MNKPVWLYWDNIKDNKEPPYITLCKWTMLHHWKDENLVFVNSHNVEFYLPGIKKKISQIEVDVRGRLDKFRRKFFTYQPNLAVKCDVIRANLLKEYGGFYVDISSVALKPITQYQHLLSADKNFFISQRQTHGKKHYPVSFYGCLKKTNLISLYCDKIDELLKNKNQFHYNELGASTLQAIIQDHIGSVTVLPEHEFIPISFEDADTFYLDQNLAVKDFIAPNTHIFKLFSRPFKETLKECSIADLYYHPGLIGKIFRYSLPENIFKYYLEKAK